ncbi:erythromycin esterase [Streptosporangium becharense]|uniref:Erythromycin esterase n=1 Tax=Streptosporangium becharense TaxID=1816182 RepID=A0A7W9IH02_9ACTN|nr:erythromycin esterase family protein [Streptosporangium becharense]MBB2908866.1 erythromycin esterase [Streptosporangium becharense]MBB5820116.1 erythromycin esterase [Streptosporangium becharense]
MAREHKRISRLGLPVTAVIAAGAFLIPVAAQAAPVAAQTGLVTARATPVAAQAAPVGEAGGGQDPVHALEQAAQPLRSTEPGGNRVDLRALGSMIGDAKVVGLGEATHGSHEFFTMKERVFRHLVKEKGFTTFALELGWPAGVQIDDYLQTGKGDARKIAKEALAGTPWDREEFVHLIEWMRDHNRRHPGRTVHFIGNDIAAPKLGDDFFGRVTDYVRRDHPESLPRVTELYTGLRPIDDVFAYLGKPLAERQKLAANAQEALKLINGQKGTDDEFELAVQNARSISQTATFLAFDFTDKAALPAAQRYRDQVMADNTVWWQRRTGEKVLVSAQNSHVGYVASDPALYPKTQGSYLRDALGGKYLPIGFTFDRGSFLSKDTAIGGDWKKFTVDAAGPGTNEHTLDRVRHRDYYLDIRRAPAAARAWLNVARPTRNIGTQYPYPLDDVAIARSFDVLIHLHDIREARMPKP